MKRILGLLIATALFASCNPTSTKNQSETITDVAALKTIELHVTGMTCEGCESTVKKAVNEINGVTSSSASHIKELTVVSFDSTLTSIEEISEAISKTGYTVVGEMVNLDKPVE
ncbi:MAG: cation transporter [Lentimicrobium sp.]|nr:cation transporter [Lentimicrobium sp.]